MGLNLCNSSFSFFFGYSIWVSGMNLCCNTTVLPRALISILYVILGYWYFSYCFAIKVVILMTETICSSYF
jgi:hypothetical protein